jgi:hypothetical protein
MIKVNPIFLLNLIVIPSHKSLKIGPGIKQYGSKHSEYKIRQS